jgi:hypothetical protein
MFGRTYTAESGQKIKVGSPFDKSLRDFVKTTRDMVVSRDLSIPRAEFLTNLVHDQIRYAEDEEYSGPGQLYQRIWSQRNPNLGEFIKARAGKCREINMILHYVLAMTGKENRFVTGYTENGQGIKHAWVEYSDTQTGIDMVADASDNFVLPKSEAYDSMYGGIKDAKSFKLF